MDPDNQKSLSAPEICAILEACDKAKVRVLKYAGLYLRFGPSPAEAAARMAPQLAPAKEIAATQLKISEHSRIAEEIREGEDYIANLALTDPAGYEALIAQGKLTLDGSIPEPDDDGIDD